MLPSVNKDASVPAAAITETFSQFHIQRLLQNVGMKVSRMESPPPQPSVNITRLTT